MIITTTVKRYYFDISVAGVTLDPMAIWGDFTRNIISTGFEYKLDFALTE